MKDMSVQQLFTTHITQTIEDFSKIDYNIIINGASPLLVLWVLNKVLNNVWQSVHIVNL